jgi:DNA-directed RNA polymerase subunit beta'
MASPFNTEAQFEKIKRDVETSFAKALDVQAAGTGRKLVVRRVWVDDNKDPGDFESQRDALRSDKTWAVPVYASLELVDRNTGKVLSQMPKLKVALLPRATNLGSYIVNGKHYQVQNQFRRKPGVYLTEKENGEKKTEFNIPGRPFDLTYDKETGVFKMMRGGTDGSGVALYPILSRMGVSDSAMAKAWGQDVLDANKAAVKKTGEQDVIKAGEYFTRAKHDSADGAIKAIGDFFETSAELNPAATESTIGKPVSRVNHDTILTGAAELLKLERGQRDPDDREALEFKKTMLASDLIGERLMQPNGELAPKLAELRKKIFYRLNNRKSSPTDIKKLVSTNELSGVFNTFFTESSLANSTDQINPISIINGVSKVTIMGDGGVKSERAVRKEEHLLHPSHLGFIDPIHTPDSGKIGTTMNLPIGSSKEGDDLKTTIVDARTGKSRKASPAEIRKLVIAFPDQYRDGKFVSDKVRVMIKGDIHLVPAAQVDAAFASTQQAFSAASNTIPFLPAAGGVRAQMATKMVEQAIPLVSREAPLVQVKAGGQTMESTIGEGFSSRASEDGVIEKVTASKISIRTKAGVVEQPIYNNLPLNGNAFLHSNSLVKPGDKVKKGQVIADSNFTDKGALAIGTNLRAAYIPYKGYNFEDGIVITESAAKKLTSEHMHEHAVLGDKGDEFSKDAFIAWRPNELSSDQLGKLDGDGVVKKGQVLKKGDPIWVGTRENKYDPEYIAMKKIAPSIKPRRGHMEAWSHDVDGTVVDVVKEGRKVKVYVKTQEPAQIGDKVTNRHGGKGIITKIIPDGEAPYTIGKDGEQEKVDILLNPHGIVTRINPSQILETAAAKIADKNGKPYIVNNFSGENYAQEVMDQLEKNKISDTEKLFDPHSKEALGDVLVGPHYVLKLSKQVTKQFSARSEGRYDINRAPLRGGEEGAKSLDLLAFYSMLSHGSRANLREMATYKGTQNDQFWNWLQAGHKSGLVPPPPEPTFAYKKFEAYLNGAGVNTKRNGSKIVIQPMTDREVTNLSSGAIKEPIFVRGKDLNPEPGGLFDVGIFGGMGGDRWGHIELNEPMPNPAFETPIKVLTGLKDPQYKGLLNGSLFVDPSTGQFSDKGVTGGEAFKLLLGKIDLNTEIKTWTDQAKTAKTEAKLDEAHKRLKYLNGLKKAGVRPEEAYVQTKIPIIPPQFRPVNETDDGQISSAGLNTLYRDISLVNNELAWQKNVSYLPEPIKGEMRENLYGGIAALYGLGDPIAKYPYQRKPQGIIEQIKGPNPKEGFFLGKVIRRNQDLVGRGTIIPEPKLGLDEMGMPEPMAWEIFRPFVVRRLVTVGGRSPSDAAKEVDEKTPAAKSALLAEMEERPVLLNRAPSLHKFSIMGFKPVLTDGKAIKIPPLVVKGFNADFDGDAMNVHVPILPDAIEEARKMMPSNNLYNPGSGQIMIQPQNEAALGLFLMSKDPAQKARILEVLPPALQQKYKDIPIDKSGIKALTKDLAEQFPRDYGKILDKLKELGDHHTYNVGFTVSMKDLLPKIEGRDEIVKETEREVGKLNLFDPTQRQKAAEILSDSRNRLDAAVTQSLSKTPNNLNLMVQSGARGNLNQLKQTVSTPFMVDDHKGRPIPLPVSKSFAEGLPFSEYWSTLYGARASAVDKQLQTSTPGAFNKDIMAASVSTVVAKDDCGTRSGIDMAISSSDIDERFLAKDISIGGSVIAYAGSAVTPGLLNILRDRKIQKVTVRSPLTCKLPQGVCAKCYGINEHGNLPAMGDNVGATSGQAMSEPLTQMTMRTFHSGGISGTRGIISGYDKIDKLLKMPEIKAGKAVLAKTSGRIESIADAVGQTGKDVKVGGVPHFISNDLWDPDKARVGMAVEKGDILSLGVVQPDELADLKGMRAAQEYISDEIQSAYKKEGIGLKRRVVETVLRAVGNTTKVIDPGDSAFLPGDVAPWTVVEDHNSKSLGKKLLGDAEGMSLQEDVAGLTKGTVIDERVRKLLEKTGVTKVEVGPKPIAHKPFLKGIQRIPMLRDDWMSQMGYRELQKAIVEGAATTSETDIHGYAPIPAFAYGAEFGQEPTGKSVREGVY